VSFHLPRNASAFRTAYPPEAGPFPILVLSQISSGSQMVIDFKASPGSGLRFGCSLPSAWERFV